MPKGTIILDGLDAAETTALSKVKAEALTPGQHPVDVTVRVTGVLAKGADYETRPTVSVPHRHAEVLMMVPVFCP